MTRLALAAALLVGCGGGSSAARPLPPVSPPTESAPAPPPEERAPDHCGGYAVAVAPALGRIARSAEAFLERLSAARQATEVVQAADALATSLDRERPALDRIRTSVPDLDAAHGRLAAALSGLAGAVRALGLSYTDAERKAEREAASQALNGAIREWAESVQGIQTVCPGLE